MSSNWSYFLDLREEFCPTLLLSFTFCLIPFFLPSHVLLPSQPGPSSSAFLLPFPRGHILSAQPSLPSVGKLTLTLPAHATAQALKRLSSSSSSNMSC